MSFKFADIEGIDEELAAKLDGDSAITEAINKTIEESVKNRNDVSLQEFKKKMDALGAKLSAAEERLKSAPDIDADELKALKELRDKNPELKATMEAMAKRTEAAEAKLKENEAKVQQMHLSNAVTKAINEYNVANPTANVLPDMHDFVEDLAKKSLRYDEDARAFRVYKNDSIVATDKGAATPVDWLEMTRAERPNMFAKTSGGGAPGSTSRGSADSKTISRSEFNALPAVEQAKVARTHALTD